LREFQLEIPTTKQVKQSKHRDNFIESLLKSNPFFRLGSSLGGLGFKQDILNHPWLSTVDWDAVDKIPESVINKSKRGSILDRIKNMILPSQLEQPAKTTLAQTDSNSSGSSTLVQQTLLDLYFPPYDHEAETAEILLVPPMEPFDITDLPAE
jgi:serine/threonine protein kinase